MCTSTGHQDHQASGHGPIVKPNYRNCDPDRIAQWQANSATNPDSLTVSGLPRYGGSSYRNDMLVTGLAHETFPYAHSNMIETPSQFLSICPSYGVDETYRNLGASSTGSQVSGVDPTFEMSQGHALDMTQLIPGEQNFTNSSTVNNMAYEAMPTPGFFPGLTEIHPPMVLGKYDAGYILPAEWDHQVIYQDNAVGVSQPLEYSPVSGLAPSMSSSFSQHSLLGQLPDTPVSMDLHEDWPTGETNPVNESFQHFHAGGPVPIQSPFDLSADSERFAFHINNDFSHSDSPLSTIRPSNPFQRTPLSMDAWVGPEPAYGFTSYPGMDGSRRSSDGEAGRNARENPLYKAVPQPDGLYHCPFLKDGCSKSPEKLKCNYE